MPLWFVGGDARSRFAVDFLRSKGVQVHCHAVPQLPSEALPAQIDRLVLPFPSVRGEVLQGSSPLPVAPLLARVKQTVYGGKLDALECRSAHLVDLFGSEPMSSLNAIPTAEGAILLALQAQKRTLCGSKCLVTGFGRCGKILAARLHALGAQVSVSARNTKDLALIAALGYESLPLCTLNCRPFDCIFNTIPAPILSPDFSGFYFELASPPGGLRPEIDLGARRIDAQGLPGRFFPETAGTLYGEAIWAHYKEETI